MKRNSPLLEEMVSITHYQSIHEALIHQDNSLTHIRRKIHYHLHFSKNMMLLIQSWLFIPRHKLHRLKCKPSVQIAPINFEDLRMHIKYHRVTYRQPTPNKFQSLNNKKKMNFDKLGARWSQGYLRTCHHLSMLLIRPRKPKGNNNLINSII